MENTNINIPAATVDGFIEMLAKVYMAAIKMGLSLKSIPTPFLWGPPGVGKSEGVRQLAERVEKNTG